MRRYNPKEIEPKWQAVWEKSRIYQATEDEPKPKRYVLEYFPYPSGSAMHVGHVRNYTMGDVISRFKRMSGYNVLHPMGWDAFGLPAENYAIKTGISPQAAVAQNVENFKEQLSQMGFSYDWSREINSTDPSYYKWTQWFFKLLFERGLAYQKESLQWWCPHDKTVLANEQVEDGKCWRCGHEVEKKSLKQWFFKITEYADRLDRDLANLNWSEAIKAMQHNWIGRSVGAEIDFAVDGHKEKIKVFTTRPDTIFGATFIVVAPEHEILNKLSIPQEVKDYVRNAERKSEIERQETEREKTGVFTGLYALNPANKEKIPIWVADYVLPGYGTGAIMAVPSHDERDFAFARKFDLPIQAVIEPLFEKDSPGNEPRPDKPLVERQAISAVVKHWSEDKYLGLKWKQVGWETFLTGGIEEGQTAEQAAVAEIAEETGYKHPKLVKDLGKIHAKFFHGPKDENRFAHFTALYFELEDGDRDKVDDSEKQKHSVVWLSPDEVASFRLPSSHRLIWDDLRSGKSIYDGEGIMVNSGKYDGLSSAEARERIVEDLAKKGSAKDRVNYKIRDWLISRQRYWGAPIPIIHCQKCGTVSVPDDQLPVVLPEIKSYEPSGDGRSPLANVPEFVNTTCPKCGGPAKRETDTMDGFACSSWYFLRFADPRNDKAAFAKDKVKFWLPVDDYIGGAEHAVMHLLYARFWTKVMFDAGLIDFEEPFTTLRNHGMILAPDGQKMSKSKGNTIEPGGLIEQGYGADSIRLMELFIGPWDQAASWSIEGIGGMFRFLQRVWTLTCEYLEAPAEPKSNVEETAILAAVHRTTKKVSEDIEKLDFNTALAAMMSLVNELYKFKAGGIAKTPAWRQAVETLLQLLAPFAPHMAEELWQELGHSESIHLSHWPAWDERLIAQDSITLAVQINGKVRAEINVAADISEQDAVAEAKHAVAGGLAGKTVKKAIYVPGRLVSLVV